MTIQQLFAKYVDGSINPEEFSRLYELMQGEYDPDILDEILESAYANPAFAVEGGDYEKKDVLAAVLAEIESREAVQAAHRPVLGLRRRRWAAMAAAVLIFLLTGSLYLYWRGKGAAEGVSVAKPEPRLDASPGRNGAVLTLADGRQVSLDSAQNGFLEQQGNAKLRKDGGQISYQAAGKEGAGAAAGVAYNTITTPRGRQFRLVLADGTRVMLNAASSIRYPTVFSGKERRVFVTGEAYFDVEHDAGNPFRVELSKGTVEVLGTRFDLCDYADEGQVDATLTGGVVSLSTGSDPAVLKPGQRGRIDRATGAMSIKQVDTAAVTAWTRGRLDIGNTDFAGLMRQVSRWYDVDVVFQGKVPNVRIGGILNRNANLSTVMEYLEANGVHYTTKEKTILITP